MLSTLGALAPGLLLFACKAGGGGDPPPAAEMVEPPPFFVDCKTPLEDGYQIGRILFVQKPMSFNNSMLAGSDESPCSGTIDPAIGRASMVVSVFKDEAGQRKRKVEVWWIEVQRRATEAETVVTRPDGAVFARVVNHREGDGEGDPVAAKKDGPDNASDKKDAPQNATAKKDDGDDAAPKTVEPGATTPEKAD
jgi:hypothetical protein